MLGRRLSVLLVLSLACAAPALAYDESLPGEHAPACSALCRSWMGTAEPAEAPVPTARPSPAPPAQPSAAVPARSRPTAVEPVARVANRPRRVAERIVPLPVPRPIALVQGPAPGRVEFPAPAAPAPAAPRPEPAAANSPAGTPAPAVVIQQAIPVPDVPAPAALATPAPAAAAEVTPAPPAEASPPPPARPVEPSAASAAAPDPGTPPSVKLGFYAVLAALVGWGFRVPRARTPARMPVTRRRRSARVREIGAQHAAVDAL